jgi:hypothetical protein
MKTGFVSVIYMRQIQGGIARMRGSEIDNGHDRNSDFERERELGG